jgi:hypothetical protein
MNLTSRHELLSFPPVLPVASLAFILAASLVALFAWWAGRPRVAGGVTSWDVAAALMLVGCAAAILGEVEHLIEFFWPHETQTKMKSRP